MLLGIFSYSLLSMASTQFLLRHRRRFCRNKKAVHRLMRLGEAPSTEDVEEARVSLYTAAENLSPFNGFVKIKHPVPVMLTPIAPCCQFPLNPPPSSPGFSAGRADQAGTGDPRCQAPAR